MKQSVDVIIIGGGMVGLAFAKALGDASIKTAVIESHEPRLSWEEGDVTARVSAIHVATQQFLEKIGVYSSFSKKAVAALRCLKVWDAIGGSEITLDSAELGQPALGAIIENREIIRVLWAALQTHQSVELLPSVSPVECDEVAEGVQLSLSNGSVLEAKLIVGADGAHSWVRDCMQVERKERPYQQSAIVAVVQTEQPHQYTGWQAFSGGDVLALLPLADPNQCAIVWSVKPETANSLMGRSRASFDDELNNAFGLRLGLIKTLNEPVAIPLTMRHVKQYVKPRFALVGDAAHTIHPLAGQGVNLGFMDAACLSHSLIAEAKRGRDIGSLRALRRYERARKGDNSAMLAAMRGFKELFANQSSWVIQARNVGLQFTDRCGVLKRFFMKTALGPVDRYFS